MPQALSMQLAVPTPPVPDFPPPGDLAARVSRTELTKEKNLYVSDTKGNSRLVRLTEHCEYKMVHYQPFAKSSGGMIFERKIVWQEPIATFQALSSLPKAVLPAVIITVCPDNLTSAGWRALPDRSIALLPMPHVLSFVVNRPDLAEDPSAQMEVIAKVAQLIALLTGGSVELTDAAQGESEDHSASLGLHRSQRQSISELLDNLVNSLMSRGRPEDTHTAMGLSRLAEKLSLVLKEANSLIDPSLLQEVESLLKQCAITAQIAPEQKGLALIDRQYNLALLKPGSVFNTGMEHDGLAVPAKPGMNKGHGEMKNREGPVGRKSASEVGRPESGNKAAVNTSHNTSHNNSAAPISSPQVMGSLNQLLAAMGLANIAQPPLAVESGAKQLPPIILPNPGIRLSDRKRKTRKQLKDEEEKEREEKEREEKEREGESFLFDDGPFEPFDDE